MTWDAAMSTTGDGETLDRLRARVARDRVESLPRDSGRRRRLKRRPPTYNHRPMIDREQVLHVARLARLELSEDEVEQMATELSGILDHVDRISELDLADVEPTSHVVALENVLRPDEPVPSLPRERALEQAPDPDEGAFRVPSPGAT